MKSNLLLLHGAIGAKDQLEPLKAQLQDKFEVESISFSGHGGKAMPEAFSIPRFAEDVLEYLEENSLKQVSIFGYSMGGYVGLYLAKHYPEKIDKVFTLATKFLWTEEIAQKEIRHLNPEKIIEKVPAFGKQLENRHQPEDWKEVLRQTADMMIGLGKEPALSGEDFEAIQHPVTIALGDRDRMVTFQETLEVYQQLPQARFLVMPETAHPIEKVPVGRLVREISEFFGS